MEDLYESISIVMRKLETINLIFEPTINLFIRCDELQASRSMLNELENIHDAEIVFALSTRLLGEFSEYS